MSVTYGHARTFTLGDSRSTLEIRDEMRERESACETIYVERVRIDRVRLMATPKHDIIIDRLSYCGKNVENRKWLSKELWITMAKKKILYQNISFSIRICFLPSTSSSGRETGERYAHHSRYCTFDYYPRDRRTEYDSSLYDKTMNLFEIIVFGNVKGKLNSFLDGGAFTR